MNANPLRKASRLTYTDPGTLYHQHVNLTVVVPVELPRRAWGVHHGSEYHDAKKAAIEFAESYVRATEFGEVMSWPDPKVTVGEHAYHADGRATFEVTVVIKGDRDIYVD